MEILLESKVLLSNNFFHTNLILFKVQTVIKSRSLMMAGGLARSHFDFFDMHFQFLAFVKL